MHLIPHELSTGEVFFSPMLARCRAWSRRRHDHGGAFQPFPSVALLVLSVAGADRVDRDLHRPVLHLSDSGVRA
jgi:hypothetical protein